MQRYCGHITRILFRKEDFAIAKFRTREEVEAPSRELTVVGNLLSTFTNKDLLEIFGKWEENERFGRQLRLDTAHLQKPINVSEMACYLAAQISGVGPHRAKLLVAYFGDTLTDVLERNPERLLEVKGIGKDSAERIATGWKNDAIDRELSLLLSSIGVGGSWARRIRRQLGDNAVQVLKDNPYRLVDVHGIGFKKADEIARRLGYDEASDERARAVLFFLLERAATEGHSFLPEGALLELATQECNISYEQAVAQLQLVLDNTVQSPLLVRQIAKTKTGVTTPIVYLQRLFRAEKRLAQDLLRLIAGKPYRQFELLHINLSIQRAEKDLRITLNEKQREAIRMTLSHSVSVLTGGPGTGKTTVLKVLVRVAQDLGLRFSLAAPTGRASKRMNEVTGEAAGTIHRLLQYSHKDRGFQKNREDQLDNDLVILDEMSMVGVSLARDMAEAIPTGACILLVGDPNQLPSVDAGRVLDDLLQSGCVPKIELTEIFRQAQKSLIVKNAHNILHGTLPQFFYDPQGKTGPLTYDCYMVNAPTLPNSKSVDGERVKNLVARLAVERVPAKLGLDPIRDVQVLIPQKRGTCGTWEMNAHLQQALNPRPEKERIKINGREYRIGDRVMAMKNNYTLDVFNGDIGFVRKFDAEEKKFLIDFDDREVIYPFEDSDDLQLAYATTIHKSQGSEYKVVIAVVLNEHFIMLKRNLLYTATTRAKQLLLFVAQSRALEIAVQQNEVDRRNSGLILQLLNNVKQAEAA